MSRAGLGLAAILAITACEQPGDLDQDPQLRASPISVQPAWQAVAQHGDVPPGIWEASASFARGKDANVIYRFGGQTGSFPDDPTLNDFYALDLDTGTWTNLAFTQPPTPRAETVMIPGPCGNCVSVVGGRGRFRTGDDLMFPEMWTYHTKSQSWEQAAGEQLGDPLAVRRSSAVVVAVADPDHPNKKKTLYAFGGVGNTLSGFARTPTGLRNDVAVYDYDSGWSVIPTVGEAPAPRAWASGGYDPDSESLLVFGGYRLGADQGPETPPWELFGATNYENDLWSFDLATSAWTQLEPVGPVPSPRDNAVAFFDAAHGGLVVYGGQTFAGLSDELWFYSVDDNEWTQIPLDPSAAVPAMRVGGVFFVQETPTTYELYLQGGSSSDGGPSEFFDDLWKLSWPKI
ncbi:Kelch repeat-containing protein [Enhygromyxa salina]|uniref:Kelch motif protein n=1 Tax=Enhygromyxa salina TaxID=215803 RepID=A0A2S9XLN5_9BACT|nr:kelch repeat-containing protein [Enhygromyxa salina]PRP93640.1 Kelch motif protein [Enhygromyxa salina]